MNKHIELVRKRLDDPDSVTQKELNENFDAAEAAYHAASDAEDCACVVYYAALYAKYTSELDRHSALARRSVKKYEELTRGE